MTCAYQSNTYSINAAIYEGPKLVGQIHSLADVSSEDILNPKRLNIFAASEHLNRVLWFVVIHPLFGRGSAGKLLRI